MNLQAPTPTTESSPSPTSLYNRLETLWTQTTRAEISGSLGDIGTFIPLFVALGRQRLIAVAPALFCAGLCNLIAGLVFDIPMPIQPMKSIVSVALLSLLSKQQVSLAGVWMGAFLLLLGITNGIELVHRLLPDSIVSGIQIGVGMSLALHGIDMIKDLNSWTEEVDCKLLALMAALVSLYLMRPNDDTTSSSSSCLGGRRIPVGLFLFGIGTLIAIVELVIHSPSSSTTSWSLVPILEWNTLAGSTLNDWKVALLQGAIPQLPLTILNSVISTCCLASSLCNKTLSRQKVCLSVGAMNLVLCPLGAMPTCHGAGGLAGQHQFGARHGASVVVLGLAKMLLAIFAGKYILTFLDAIPAAILGVMLAIAGHALGLQGLLLVMKEDRCIRVDGTIALVTALVILGTKKTHYGALAGWVTHIIYGDGLSRCFGSHHTRDDVVYSQVVMTDNEDEHGREDHVL